MMRKCALAVGLFVAVSALVLDGSASTAQACNTCCKPRCCRPRCCAPTCCTTCYVVAPAPCCAPAPRCNTCYVAPSCSTCGVVYVAPTPVNVVQVPGYGAAYGYAAPVVSYPTRTVVRTRVVALR